jgi:hypothetical protein
MCIEHMMQYMSQHIILSNTAHVAGGFGIAVLLQHYLKGHAFVSAWIGWVLVAFSFGVHILAFMS